MPDTNKISYGLSTLKYAPITTISNTGVPTYGAVKDIPGAVEISLDKEGDTYIKYADNIAYFTTAVNSGYSGSFTVTRLPDSFYTDCLGYKTDANGVLVEDADATSTAFALLFKFKGDVTDTDYVMYNCIADRPSVASSTKEDTIEANDISVDITCKTIYCESLSANIVKAYETHNDSHTWFSTVYIPTATPSTEEEQEQEGE